MIGNFIADYVKGNKKNDFPEKIRKGIELHRAIDDFTDHHPLTGRSKERIRKKYSRKVYDILMVNHSDLPEQVQYFLPFMVERNWLLNYATVEGIGRTLAGLSKRVNFENKMDEATEELKLFYPDFEIDFMEFFPKLTEFSKEKRKKLLLIS